MDLKIISPTTLSPPLRLRRRSRTMTKSLIVDVVAKDPILTTSKIDHKF
jgi:hypothetical protein